MRIDGNNEGTALTRIPALAVSPANVTYVLDPMANEIRIFDPHGREANRIGGTGAGPGELQRPSRLALGGDTLFVIDQRGLNRFHGDGTFIHRTPVANPARMRNTRNMLLYPQSLAHSTVGIITSFPPYRHGRSAGVVRDTSTLHMLDVASGTSSEPIAEVITNDLYTITSFGSGPGWFVPDPSFAVSPDGAIYITNPDGIDIDVRSLTGAPPFRIRFTVPRRPVLDAHVESIRERTIQSMRASAIAPADVALYAAGLRSYPRAKFIPVVGRLVAASTGEILVERPDLKSDYPGSRASPTTWDMLESNGSMIARVELPAATTPLAASRHTITCVALDSFDVPTVIRYDVVIERR
jgi:hypothetical protein